MLNPRSYRVPVKRFCIRSLLLLLATILCGLAPESAQAETFYFMTVFGSQHQPPLGDRVHSFATFVKATGTGDDWNQYRLEVHTISWLPETMDIKIWRMTPEPGENFGLFKTLDWALSDGAAVQKWGPYQISCDTYRRALHRIGILNADLITYQAIDPLFRTEISNCIHAISGIDPYDARARYPLIRVGFSASRHIVDVFASHGMILDSQANHCWLDRRMGLHRYEIETRALQQRPQLFQVLTNSLPSETNQFADVKVSVCPDFVVPPGFQYCPGHRPKH